MKKGRDYKKMEGALIQPKIDFAFKLLFGQEKNIHLLRYFLGAVLNLEEGELENLQLVPTEQVRESEYDKTSVFDVAAKCIQFIILQKMRRTIR